MCSEDRHLCYRCRRCSEIAVSEKTIADIEFPLLPPPIDLSIRRAVNDRIFKGSRNGIRFDREISGPDLVAAGDLGTGRVNYGNIGEISIEANGGSWTVTQSAIFIPVTDQAKLCKPGRATIPAQKKADGLAAERFHQPAFNCHQPSPIARVSIERAKCASFGNN